MRSYTFWENKYAFPLASILVLPFCLLQVFLVSFEFFHQLLQSPYVFGTVHFAEAVVNATLKLEPGQYCTENFSVQVLWQEAEIKLEIIH